jgi:hypothetical protein
MHIQSLHLLHETFPVSNCYPFNLEIFQKTPRIHKVACEDTDYFQIYRDFLYTREKYLYEI